MKTRSLPKKTKLKKSSSRRQSWLCKVELPSGYQLSGSDPACLAMGHSAYMAAYNFAINAAYWTAVAGCATYSCFELLYNAIKEGDVEPLFECVEAADEEYCFDYGTAVSQSSVAEAAASLAGALAYENWCGGYNLLHPFWGCKCCLVYDC